jgi:hypothetical protein
MNGSEAKLRLSTEFPIPAKPIIGISSKVFLQGSCFSENIGLRLQEAGFDTNINPFGILYNPLSISNAVDRIIEKKLYSEGELYFHGGKFHSLDHHGSFQSSTPAVVVQEINDQITAAHDFLKDANVAIITLGTAFVYYHQTSQKAVANCHKIPGTEFEKILLSEKEITDALRIMENRLVSFNPAIQICYTISPVKHLRDGVAENALSKARLLSSLQLFRAAGGHPSDYFPAFEIMNEELRDHRFYADDLAHPSAWAVNYIFDRFLQCRFDERALQYVTRFAHFQRMANHKPVTTDNSELTAWANKKKEVLDALKLEFPEKDFSFISG